MKKTILFLSSNPVTTAELDLGETKLNLGREIQDSINTIEKSIDEARFSVKPIQAVRPKDLQDTLLKVKPNIVHFCGHGVENGLILEDDAGQPVLLSKEALAETFRLFSNQIECVILNACFTVFQAEEIVKYINYVIGMNQPILDRSAIAFSRGFYSALGAGKSISEAFDFGRNRILLELSDRLTTKRKAVLKNAGIKTTIQPVSEHLIPILFTKKNLTEIEPIDSERQRFHVPEIYPDNSYPKCKLVDYQEIMHKIINSVFKNQYTIIWGKAGYGKTCFAWSICFLKEILEHFQGGVFWLNLNEIQEQSKVYKVLYHQLVNYDSEKKNELERQINNLEPTELLEVLSNNIRQEWGNKKCLIVLDSAKKDSDLTNNIVSLGTKDCCWLITTQEQFLNLDEKTNKLQINFEIEDCINLLSNDLIKNDLIEKEQLENLDIQNKIIKLASILYEYPPLVTLARARIKQIQEEFGSVEEILEIVIEDFLELTWEQLNTKPVIADNFEESLKSLNNEEIEKLQSLCIFPIEQDIPFAVLNKYWETKNSFTRNLCRKFYSRSLLKIFEAKKEIEIIRIDPLLKDYFLTEKEDLLERQITYWQQKLIAQYDDFDFNLLKPNINSSLTDREINYLKMNGKYHLLKAKEVKN